MFNASGKRVLIVEDDDAVMELLTTRLELAGHKTFIARDGYKVAIR
jgi:DNA-binding response OmpR family regulator